MQRSIALTISTLFHPLYMPLLCILVAGEADWYIRGRVPVEQRQLLYLVVALSTIVFPGINILLLRWYGAVSHLSIPDRRERFVPFISSLFFFILGYSLLRRAGLPAAIYSVYLGCIVSTVALALINFRLKVSAHAAGITGLLGALLALFKIHGWSDLTLLMASILACGLVYTARMLLRMHTPVEVYGGALIGFSFLYLCVSQLWVI